MGSKQKVLKYMFSLNVFIASTKQGVGPQVFPTLVTALPLQYTYEALHRQWRTYLSRYMRFPTIRYVRPAKAQTSLRIRAVWSEPLLVSWILHDCRATDRIYLKFLSPTEGCIGSSESTLLKLPHCWKSRVAAHFHTCRHVHEGRFLCS